MKTKHENFNTGPGAYAPANICTMGRVNLPGAESQKGVFSNTDREKKPNTVPGPGTYFNLKYGVPDETQKNQADQFSLNRKERKTDIEPPKADYDGSAYYKLKYTGKMVRYQKGFTLRDSLYHISEDHHKKNFPGVGYYNAVQAFDIAAANAGNGP